MAELLDEIHHGEILLEDYMKPMGIIGFIKSSSKISPG